VVTYIGKRLATAVVVVLLVITISFYLVRLMPGNAVSYLQSQLVQQGGLTPAQIDARISAIYGVVPKGPIWNQYLQYMGNVLRGNFGNSVLDPGASVVSIVAGALPWTVFVVAVALLLSFGLGLVFGTLMATLRNTWFGRVLTFVASLTSAIPNYIIAMILLYELADVRPIFPVSGGYDSTLIPGFNLPFLLSVLQHGVLPILAYTIAAFGSWSLTMKGSVIPTLGAEYVRAAESWGLSSRRIFQSYVGRNSLLPLVTAFALSLGYLFGGSVFIETIFTYPGIGYHLIEAIDERDYSVMMGCFILISITVVVCNLVVDLMYPIIDPRIVSPARNRRARRSEAAEEAMAATT
jgi:peptide/nickel transport system permease protein